MEGFAYADPVRVARLIKGGANAWQMILLEENLVDLSAKLSAWYPGLRAAWDKDPEGSTLRELVRVMVSSAARKTAVNPEGISSETMGPYAYSKFDSEDTARALFSLQDLKALEALLQAEQNQIRGSFTMKSTMLPAGPMPRPGWYTNSRRWKW
ncbi:MAG: hypothetical protein PHW63_10630 [Alphaproteobacteria bacterium]|nr:hypothetical protein [Alphaproteobacteria bacterium]